VAEHVARSVTDTISSQEAQDQQLHQTIMQPRNGGVPTWAKSVANSHLLKSKTLQGRGWTYGELVNGNSNSRNISTKNLKLPNSALEQGKAHC
jgi:hypothetical protein